MQTAAKRGKLTIFFGSSPGVGKTYAMLEAARSERDLKRDVVIGLVETHGRYDIGALVIGLELLAPHGAELDVDGVLARKPGLVLVDELAHTNAPGSRHTKRWKDVEEILEAGIDVYTTLDVQHLESLNDVVAQITGVVVKDTLPDHVLDGADDVRLIDLPIDELLERLAAGLLKEDAAVPSRDFFRKGNLIALRELALRRTAERVDAQMRVYREAHGIERAWPVRERILVCVSPSPTSARLVRAARRMASGLHAELIAAYVETPAALRLSNEDRERVAQNLRLAEQLGAEPVTLTGASAAEETIRYARARNATKIVVGKPTHPRWRDLLRISFLEEVVRGSREIDVYVIAGEGELAPASEAKVPRDTRGLLLAPIVVATATALAWVLFGRTQLPDVVMVYLLAIVLVAARASYGASLLATVLSVFTLDFIFVPPYMSFDVREVSHVVTFGVMFVVAVVISSLTKRIREAASAARQRELRTARLYAMSRELASAQEASTVAAAAARHLEDAFDAEVALLLPNAAQKLTPLDSPRAFTLGDAEIAAADWVWNAGKAAGLSTDTLPSARGLFVPLVGARGKVGVLGIRPRSPQSLVNPEQRQLVDTFASQVGSALERARLSEEAQHARVEAEAERMRSSLLSSVSHDLRTPLGVITGASSALRGKAALSAEARRDLIDTIDEEAGRLNRLVRNLLDMTRLASGAIKPAKEWHPLDEVVGVALGRVEDRMGARKVDVKLPADLPPIPMDAVLIEQVLINLLENAVKYTPEGSPLDLSARREDGRVVVTLADRGPGIPEGEREAVFDKFYRMKGAPGTSAGLGLAICRGIVEAHGGRIWVDGREGGGAAFSFSMPIEETMALPSG